MGLLEEQLKDKKLPAPKAAPSPSGLLPLEAPKHWTEEAMERDGKAKFFGKMLLGGFTGMGPLLFPESIGAKARYASELAAYQDVLAEQQGRSRHQAGLDLLMNGVDDPEDAFQRLSLAKEFGIDELQYALGGGVVEEEPDYEKVEINGDYHYVDKNDPTAAPVPVSMADGTIAAKAVDGDTRKTSGWFKRAVPALENMHKLEDRGVDIDRTTLTLLAQAAQNEDGLVIPQLFNQALNNLDLSADQRQYIRNARDLSMIQLRKESGAAIGVSEMFNELEQNLMISDMSPEGYDYQRGSRARKYRALSDGLTESVLRDFRSEGLFGRMDALRKNTARRDPTVWDGKRTDFSRYKKEDFAKIVKMLPPGEYIGPDGNRWRKPAPGEAVFGRRK